MLVAVVFIGWFILLLAWLRLRTRGLSRPLAVRRGLSRLLVAGGTIVGTAGLGALAKGALHWFETGAWTPARLGDAPWMADIALALILAIVGFAMALAGTLVWELRGMGKAAAAGLKQSAGRSGRVPSIS